MKGEDPVLKRLRMICLGLPGAHETVTFGHPTFRVGTKTFAVLEEYRGHLCICFKATLTDQEILIEDSRFFIAPYIGKHGWVSLIVGGGRVNWTMAGDLVRASYLLLAPKQRLAGSKTGVAMRPRAEPASRRTGGRRRNGRGLPR